MMYKNKVSLTLFCVVSFLNQHNYVVSSSSFEDRNWDFNSTVEIPLLKASAEGDIAKVKKLLDQGEDINQSNTDGSTALFEACGFDVDSDFKVNYDLVQLLLDSGAHVNAVENMAQVTPLFIVLGFPYMDRIDLTLAQLLIDHGADINFESTMGTPLVFAALMGKDVVEFLIKNGASIKQALTSVDKALMNADDYSKSDLYKAKNFLKKYKA